MGEIFSLGFGPFRWVCCSGKEEDLRVTDSIATEVQCVVPPPCAALLVLPDCGFNSSACAVVGVGQQVIGRLRDDCTGAHKAHVRQHYDDNYLWITQAMANKLVVGSQARILYADAEVLV